MIYLTTGSTNISFYIKNSSGTADYDNGYVSNYMDDKWHQYVAIFNGDYMFFYLDGELVSSKDTALTNIRDSANPLYIGTGWSSYYLNGLLSNIRIYNNALTGTQVKSLYNAQL